MSRRSILRTVLVGCACTGMYALLTLEIRVLNSTVMQPTIPAGSHLLCYSGLGKIGMIKRHSFVVYSLPRKEFSAESVSRVVAIPGDKIQSDDTIIKILDPQGTELATYPKDAAQTGRERITVLQPDAYFLIGDSHEKAVDSRIFGPIHVNTIKSIVLRVF